MESTQESKGLELKKYLVLKGQVFFRDLKSGVSLNAFELKNVWCETPKTVLQAPDQFPVIVTAIKLGHLITSDTIPTAMPKADKKGSPMFELLQTQFDAFFARISSMRSVDVLDQLIDIEERRDVDQGGPRRQYLNALLTRRAKLVEEMQKDREAAYTGEQNPSRPAVVARQEIVPKVEKSDKPEGKKKNAKKRR